MDRIERITEMEARLDRAGAALAAYEKALEAYLAVQTDIKSLDLYYTGGDWRADFAADEAGQLPGNLKRGVLSEDGIYNVLTDNRTLFEQTQAGLAEIGRNDGSNRPLTANDYQRQAMRTLNPALGERDVLINGVMGLCGEAGEAIDLVKKHLAQGHALDRELLAKELGDVAWYLAETATAIGCDLETILAGNLEKLRARYPDGFDAERSVHREG